MGFLKYLHERKYYSTPTAECFTQSLPVWNKVSLSVHVFVQNQSCCVDCVKFLQLWFCPPLAMQFDGQPCVSPGILWDLRGLISKLLEVDFDLAFKALLSLFPLAFTQCCILAHI